MNKIITARIGAALMTAMALALPGLETAAHAQTGFLHRHRTAATVGAAVVAHHYAKARGEGTAGKRTQAQLRRASPDFEWRRGGCSRPPCSPLKSSDA